jgi:hypothetical protein
MLVKRDPIEYRNSSALARAARPGPNAGADWRQAKAGRAIARNNKRIAGDFTRES